MESTFGDGNGLARTRSATEKNTHRSPCDSDGNVKRDDMKWVAAAAPATSAATEKCCHRPLFDASRAHNTIHEADLTMHEHSARNEFAENESRWETNNMRINVLSEFSFLRFLFSYLLRRLLFSESFSAFLRFFFAAIQSSLTVSIGETNVHYILILFLRRNENEEMKRWSEGETRKKKRKKRFISQNMCKVKCDSERMPNSRPKQVEIVLQMLTWPDNASGTMWIRVIESELSSDCATFANWFTYARTHGGWFHSQHTHETETE